MTYDLGTAIELLGRTPSVLDAWLRDLPAEWLDAPEGPGLWSPRDVASHLADLERDGWMPRVTMILENGAAIALAGIERERFRDRYVDTPIAMVIEEFRDSRGMNLRALRDLKLQPSQLEAIGRHSRFGEVRLSQLLSAWTVHDMTHIAQIARAMAAQYREEVGPWKQFLSVLAERE